MLKLKIRKCDSKANRLIRFHRAKSVMHFSFLMPDCTGLTVSDYILLEFCVLFRPQF